MFQQLKGIYHSLKGISQRYLSTKIAHGAGAVTLVVGLDGCGTMYKVGAAALSPAIVAGQEVVKVFGSEDGNPTVVTQAPQADPLFAYDTFTFSFPEDYITSSLLPTAPTGNSLPQDNMARAYGNTITAYNSQKNPNLIEHEHPVSDGMATEASPTERVDAVVEAEGLDAVVADETPLSAASGKSIDDGLDASGEASLTFMQDMRRSFGDHELQQYTSSSSCPSHFGTLSTGVNDTLHFAQWYLLSLMTAGLAISTAAGVLSTYHQQGKLYRTLNYDIMAEPPRALDWTAAMLSTATAKTAYALRAARVGLKRNVRKLEQHLQDGGLVKDMLYKLAGNLREVPGLRFIDEAIREEAAVLPFVQLVNQKVLDDIARRTFPDLVALLREQDPLYWKPDIHAA